LRQKDLRIEDRHRDDEILRFRRVRVRLRFLLDILAIKQSRDHRSCLSGLRRHQRDAGHTGAANDGSYEGFVYLPCMPKIISFQPREKTCRSCLSLFSKHPTGRSHAQQLAAGRLRAADDALILFDAAYEAYISDPNIPHSILRSKARSNAPWNPKFSKIGGFTGVRAVHSDAEDVACSHGFRKKIATPSLWHRRWSTKANSVSIRPTCRGSVGIRTKVGNNVAR